MQLAKPPRNQLLGGKRGVQIQIEPTDPGDRGARKRKDAPLAFACGDLKLVENGHCKCHYKKKNCKNKEPTMTGLGPAPAERYSKEKKQTSSQDSDASMPGWGRSVRVRETSNLGGGKGKKDKRLDCSAMRCERPFGGLRWVLLTGGGGGSLLLNKPHSLT